MCRYLIYLYTVVYVIFYNLERILYMAIGTNDFDDYIYRDGGMWSMMRITVVLLYIYNDNIVRLIKVMIIFLCKLIKLKIYYILLVLLIIIM